jgi:type I restriction enzyme, S subunit
MTLDTFFGKFDEFAEAPNAVQKMRELILELAVRGKLTKQFPDEESASVLYTRIEQHLKLLRSKNKLRLQPMKLLSIDALPEIPSNWMWLPLGNVIDYGSSEKIESTKIPGDAWLLDLEDIEKDTSRLLRRKTFHNSPSESTKSSFIVGDVLYGKLRPYLNKVIVADANGYCTTEIIPIKTLDFIDPNYLCYALKRPSFVAYATAKSYGMKMPRLSTDDARQAPFPLPPLAEQKRIVTKVDELMALCDRLEAQEAERKEKKRRLSRAAIARFAEKPTVGNLGLVFHKAYDVEPAEIRNVILELAVRGKLVEQDAGDKLASITFHKLRPAEKNLGSEFYPEHWLRITLGNLGEWRGGGTPSKNRPDFWEGTIPWVSPKDMKLLQISDSIDHISSTAVNESTAKMIPENSLLMVVRGMILARAFPVAQTTCDVTINQDMKAITPYYPETINFLLLTLRAIEPKILMAIEHSTHGTCKLSTDFLTNFVIGIPPLAEQKRIVAKVSELMALVDALEAELANARTLSERLLDAAIAAVIENAQLQRASLVFPQTRVADEELREAFLISRIVSKASDPDYPIGRFRRTKFSYLAHRRAGDDVTKHYIKKAAGPYSPWAKFDGPEDLARARGYVRDTKADPLEGMVAGERVGEVEERVTDPLIGEAVDWVMKNFHFETNDNLELLTTVDFAAVGLQKEGKEISREEVKKVIASSKDWTAKLKRELFSDENIDKALKRMAEVFPEMYGKA